MDIASLSVKIDTSDVARAEEDLDRLGGKGAKAEQAAERIGAAYNDAAGKVGSVSGASAKAGEALDSLGNKASAAAQSARTAGVAYGQAATGMTGASGAAAAAGAALGKSAQAMHLAGLSAGQYSQAMRMLPMQLTDVVTSLASGMPVWQVAIQQGGQVRDAFGGVGNAARAVVSAIGPVGIGLGVAAAALGTLVAAHEQGAAEARTYEQALILTGNAAGTSADALARMAIVMDKAGTTQHAAAAALAEVTGTGKFAENQIHAIAAASLAMEEVTGKAVSATVKEFSALADAPAAASAKLNEQYHYLTASVYEQISALEEQGRTTEAAKLATDTYAEAMRIRTEQMRGSLGILERAFIGLGKVASEAWDSVLDIDREKTLQQQIERTKALIEDRNTSLLGKLFPDSIGPNSKDTQFLKDRLALLESTAAANAKLAEEEGKRNQQEQANIAASKEVDRLNGLLDTLKGMGTYTSAANRWIKENAAASDEQKREVLGASIAGYTSPQYASWVAGQSGIGSIGSALSAWAAPVSAALGLIKGFSSYLDGERVDAKGSRGSIAAWATGYQPLAELNGAINKLTKMVGLDGTILGGIINAPGMILQGIGNALFGSWKIKDYGIALGVNDGELNPQSYVYKKKKGLLTGTKKKTSYDPLTGDSAQQLQEAFATTEDGVASIFEQLGYAIDDGTYAGLKIARSKISTKGKTEEEVSKAVQDWFTAAGESINSYLNATLGTGLSYDIAGMTTFVNDLYAVNGLLDHLNVSLFSTNVAGGKLVEQLLGLTGGLDALTSSVSTYYDQFFSDAEKQANTLADVTQAFADANQTLPATRAEYRAMVESIDLTTEAGRSMFATLMNLAGQADSYYDIVEQRAQAVQAATSGAAVSAAKGALSTLSSAIGAEQQRLSDAYNARVASINDRVGTANSAVSSLTAVGSSLDAALKQLAGSSEQATALLHEQAVATLRSALAFAKAGGSLAGFAGLQDALDSAGNIDSGRYSTREDLQREQGRTAGLIAQLQGVNGAQLTTEEGIVANLQAQLDQAKADYDLQAAGLDAQLSAAQAQLEALLGIDSGVKSVADALSLFVGAMQQAQALQDANASITSVIGPDGVKHQVASNGTILDQNGASMGLKVVGDQVVGTQSWNQDWRFNLGQDGQMSWAAGQQPNLQAWAKSMGIPGFATGGDFGGGLRLVGEHGPELEVTGPSRIFNARQTADLLSGGGASAEDIRGLRADMAHVFDALRAIAKHTMQTAKRAEFLERWDYDGMPTVRA